MGVEIILEVVVQAARGNGQGLFPEPVGRMDIFADDKAVTHFLRGNFIPGLVFFEIGRLHLNGDGRDHLRTAQAHGNGTAMEGNVTVPAGACAFGKNEEAFVLQDVVDFVYEFEVFRVGNIAAGANLAAHRRIALQAGFDDTVGFGHAT